MIYFLICIKFFKIFIYLSLTESTAIVPRERIKYFYVSIILIVFVFFFSNFSDMKDKVREVLMETNYGEITIKLYNETPQHRDNFIKLVESNFYDSLLFHRVINGFMIQCGDPNSRGALPKQMLGMGGPGYTIPAEFHSGLIHKKGAIASARFGDEQNPEKASSGSQFYIVQGRVYSDEELNAIEKERIEKKTYNVLHAFLSKSENSALREEIILLQKEGKIQDYNKKIEAIKLLIPNEIVEIEKFRYTQQEREIYKTIGGTPHLDYDYTVFGEVIDGFDIVEKIASVETKNERPRIDVIMKLSVIK